jgi:hypothetical protein
MSGDLQYRYKKFALLAEYADAIFKRGGGISSEGIPYNAFPSSVNGYFVQASYDIRPKWTAVAAWNSVNLDNSHSGNIVRRFSAGLRYNIVSNVFLKMEYQFTTPRSQFSGDERFSNALLTQVTFAY